MKIIKIITIVGLIIATGYIFGLAILAIQLASERAYCKYTPLDQMNKADYQYCLELNAGLKWRTGVNYQEQ